MGRKWLVAGHVDRVKRKGDYFLFKVGMESIIVVRSDESTVNAFYNVCRHRGSLICSKPEGHVARLTCGYHAWSYGLDGALLAARLMPADFAKADNGLRRVHVRVFYGFIFVNLTPRRPSILTRALRIWHRIWISTGSPMRALPIPSLIPRMRTGNWSSRIFSSVITVRRRILNSAPCTHPMRWWRLVQAQVPARRTRCRHTYLRSQPGSKRHYKHAD